MKTSNYLEQVWMSWVLYTKDDLVLFLNACDLLQNTISLACKCPEVSLSIHTVHYHQFMSSKCRALYLCLCVVTNQY